VEHEKKLKSLAAAKKGLLFLARRAPGRPSTINYLAIVSQIPPVLITAPNRYGFWNSISTAGSCSRPGAYADADLIARAASHQQPLRERRPPEQGTGKRGWNLELRGGRKTRRSIAVMTHESYPPTHMLKKADTSSAAGARIDLRKSMCSPLPDEGRSSTVAAHISLRALRLRVGESSGTQVRRRDVLSARR